MSIPRSVQLDECRRQGGQAAGLAELRRMLARPSRITDGRRQRLLDLTQRLAAVQRMGDGCDRVDISEYVRSALGQGAPTSA